MKNIHDIFCYWNETQTTVLSKSGIKVEVGYDSFWLDEDEIYWRLKPYFEKWQVSDTTISQFSEDDLTSAHMLAYNGVWSNGYPMPDSDFGYRKTTYDDSENCNTCGIGLKQKSPFRLKKPLSWGNKKMFSSNWVFDELFVKTDFYESLLKPTGIKTEKVLLYKKEIVIEDVVQLIIPETEASLNLEGYPCQTCEDCSRKRYDLFNKGFFPSFKEDVSDLQIFKSKEWFGTGASARKYIFVSQPLRKRFLTSKINANYIPCEG